MTREDDILDRAQEEIARINAGEQQLIESAHDIINTLNMRDVGQERFKLALEWLKRYHEWKQPDVVTLIRYPHPSIDSIFEEEE